jgi:flotillin
MAPAAILFILVVLGLTGIITVQNLIEICQPNEVLVFSGAANSRGYDIVHSGRKVRIPLIHRVDRIDVTNMPIDLNVTNAYSKGGIPLSVRGVANVKVGTRAPLIDNAVERFLGMPREQIMQIAKETLEGNLRGVLATLTPEEVNNDRLKFAQSLLEEAERDLRDIGLELDTLKIQSVSDERGYLDSIGRRQSATLLMESRVAEAKNRAEASVLDSENQRKKAIAKIEAQKQIAEADAERRITDAQTKAEAMVAEERSKIGAAIARAMANMEVQRARIEQVKRQLQADVVRPAQARKSELELQAKANVARTIEEGRANAEALRSLVQTWKDAGDAARPIFVMQQFDTIMGSMMSTIQDVKIDKITVIDSNLDKIDRHAALPLKTASASEQIKQTMGLDLPRLLQGVAAMQNNS